MKGKWEQSLDEATKQKVQAIMEQAKTQLAELGVEFPTKGDKGPRGDIFADLDDATKEKAQAIMEKVKDGSLTHEEAQTQLANLGVELPAKGDKGPRGDMFANLDDATKEKAQAIVEKMKDGSLTHEEAHTQLADLGIELPAKGDKGPREDLFAGLDDATKEKAQAIMDDMNAQLAELGVNFPAKFQKDSTEAAE